MSECPDVRELETTDLSPALRTHVAGCAACRRVIELVVARGLAAPGDCGEFEDLLALRTDTRLDSAEAKRLDRHLAECEHCRAIASGAMTISDIRAVRTTRTRNDVSALREVDPDAYVLGPEVARGGMGRILEARDMRVGRSVALKELLGATPSHAARFEREARVTARLQHPGIVPIYEIAKWPDGAPFYSMRMVQGRTLRSALQDAETVPERLALLPSVIAAAEAVAYAHAHRIIHRDLTPANIMVGEFGDTVVIDWGLAKDLADTNDVDAPDPGPYRGDSGASDLTVAGAVIGTAAYMPPEQAAGDVVDERADVYALGAILYHLLAGHAPYKASSSIDVLDLVKAGPPTPVGRAAPEAPRDLLSVVGKAMARTPSDRYANAGDLAAELVRFRDGRMVAAHRYSRGELMRRWIGEHRAAVIGTTAALVALLVAGTVAITGIVRERDRADAERLQAVNERTKAHDVAVSLLEEQGRQELLHGDPAKAIAYLNAAFQQGRDTPALRLMLAQAIAPLEARRQTLDCGDNWIAAFELSPDGTEVAAACGAARVWRITDGAVLANLPAVDAQQITYSHDGRWIATSGQDVDIWNARTGERRARLTGHTGRVPNVFFTDDDRQIVTLGIDGTARVWDAASGSQLRVLSLGAKPYAGSRGRLHGDVFAVVAIHGHGELWSISRGVRFATFFHGGDINMFDVSSDGSHIVTCGADGIARVWTAGGQLAHALGGHDGYLIVCSFSRDGQSLLTGDARGNAGVWNARDGQLVARLPHGTRFISWGDLRESTAVTRSGAGTLTVWDAASGAVLRRLDLAEPFGKVRLGPGDSLLAADTGKIVVFGDSARPILSFVAPRGDRDVAVNADGSRLVTRRDDGHLTLWNTRTGQAIQTVEVVQHTAQSIDRPSGDEKSDGTSISEDGRRFAAVTDGAIIVLDVEAGTTVATIPYGGPLVAIVLDRTGHRILIGGTPPSLWDVDAGQRLATFDGAIEALDMARDGKRVVVRIPGDRLQVWDVEPQRLRCSFAVSGDAWSIGFTPDGGRVALGEQAGSYGAGTLGLWNPATCERVLSTPIASAAFAPTGSLVTTFVGGRVTVRRTADGSPVSSAQLGSPGADSSYNLMPVPSAGGTFVLTADPTGDSRVIRDASDGRTLAKVGREHMASKVTVRGLETVALNSHWIGDDTVVIVSGGVSVWQLRLERRSPRELDEIVRQRSPWRVDGSRLVPVLARIHGQVTRSGRPVANASVTAVSTDNGNPYATTTDQDGDYSLDELPAAIYLVSASLQGSSSEATTVRTSADADIAADLVLRGDPTADRDRD